MKITPNLLSTVFSECTVIDGIVINQVKRTCTCTTSRPIMFIHAFVNKSIITNNVSNILSNVKGTNLFCSSDLKAVLMCLGFYAHCFLLCYNY